MIAFDDRYYNQMRLPGIIVKFILVLLMLALTLASEINPPSHNHQKKNSNQLKNKKNKHKDKGKGKKEQIGLQYLQEYQQKYGSKLIKINEISVNVPQIRQYFIVKDIYPPNDYKIDAHNMQYYQQKQVSRQIKINGMLLNVPQIRQYSIVKEIYPQKNVQIDHQDLQHSKQKQGNKPIKVNEIIADVPQIQQYSIVKDIFPSTIFDKRRDTQTIVKLLEQKWTIQQSKQLLEHNQKLIKLSNQIAKYIDKQHDKKQTLPAVQKKVETNSQQKPLEYYQRPNQEEDKKKNDLIQEIKKQLVQKQLLRKQQTKQQEKKRKQAQQIRRFDEQQMQKLKKQAEQEGKQRKQKQKQQVARLEEIERKRKINQQKYRKQQQIQMGSIAESFDAMLMNNPKMQDQLRKKIQAQHLEDQALKRSAEKRENAKSAEPHNNVQANQQTDMKDINKKVQVAKQTVNVVAKVDFSNPDEAQGPDISDQKKTPSIRQNPIQKQLSNAKNEKNLQKMIQNTKQNAIGKRKQNNLSVKQKSIPTSAEKQPESTKNQKTVKEKPLNIQDIFGTTSSRAQLKQQLLKKITKYEQEQQAKKAKKALLQASAQTKRYYGEAKNSMISYQQPKQQRQSSLKHQDEKKIKNSQNPVHKHNMRVQKDTDQALFKQLEQRIQSNKKSKQKTMKADNIKPSLVNQDTPFIQYVIYFIFGLFIILAISSRLNSFNQGPHQHFIENTIKGSRGSFIPEQDLQI